MFRRMIGGVVGCLLATAAVTAPAGESSAAVPTPVPAAAVSLAATTTSVSEYEQQVLKLTNKARAEKRKCGRTTYKARKALRWDDTLAAVARAHSLDMGTRNYFNHTTKGQGLSPFDRMKAAGYDYRTAGENIAAGYPTPAAVVKAWLKSPGHCANIMRKAFTEIGVGVAVVEGSEFTYYITQDFGRPA